MVGSGNQWQQGEVAFYLRSPLQVVFAVEFNGASLPDQQQINRSLAIDDVSLAEGQCSGGR
jgi:hypothetical protein